MKHWSIITLEKNDFCERKIEIENNNVFVDNNMEALVPSWVVYLHES